MVLEIGSIVDTVNRFFFHTHRETPTQTVLPDILFVEILNRDDFRQIFAKYDAQEKWLKDNPGRPIPWLKKIGS